MKKKVIEKEVKAIRREWKNILFNLAFAFLAVIIVSYLYRNIMLTTLLLSVITIVALVKWKSWLTFTIFLFGAIWGPLSEMMAISFGAWQYAWPNINTIPLWLFILWGDAAAFIFETAMEFKKLGVKDN